MCPHLGGTCYPSHPDSLSFTQKIQAAGPKLVTPIYKDTCIFVIVTMRIRMANFGYTHDGMVAK